MTTSTADAWDERYAQGQTPWDSGQPSAELARLLAQFEPPRGRCLEIGCGTGVNALYLAQRGFQVTAVDFAPRAVERARQRGAEQRLDVDFRVQDLAAEDAAQQLLAAGGPFPLVFDRGVYHCVRREHLAAFQRMIGAVVAPGGIYIHLAGNANDAQPADQGPPRVAAEELLAELGPQFELVQLREFQFDGVVVEGEEVRPLAWSAVWRRKDDRRYLDNYPELTELLRDRGHSDGEIARILARVRRYERQMVADSIMESIDSGEFDLAGVIAEALPEDQSG